MSTYLRNLIVLALTLTTLPAWAGHGGHRNADFGHDYSRRQYARVVDVRPLVEMVRVPVQRNICQDRPVRRRVAEYRSPAPVILGAVLGGAIGNQLSHGHGHSRIAATVAGAAIGGVVANEVQYSKHPPRYYTRTEEVCVTETSWQREERVVAWDVSWKYRGRIYHSRMDKPPGKRIPVWINVNPGYR